MSPAPLVTRRGLIVAGTAAAASAAVPALLHAPAAAAQSSDVDFLMNALELEQVLAEAYQRAAPELGGIARLLRSQERAHADALALALREMGGGAPPSADVDARLAAMSRASGKRGVAQYLIGLENSAVRTYIGGHRSVRDARLMQLATSILGDQAQHLVALRDVVGTQKVPTAFETGRG